MLVPVTTEAANTTVVEPVVKPEPGPVEVAEFVHKQYEQLAAEESKTEETPVETEAEAAATTEEKPESQESGDTTQPPFTEEELRDHAFIGRLNTEGWEKLEKYNPSLYKAAKAVAHAQGTVYELKRQLESQVRQPQQQEEPVKVDPVKEALRKADSLDENERAEGLQALVRLEAQKMLSEIGIDPIETAAVASERSAYRMAVQAMPELATLDEKALDAAVEADPDLMDDVRMAVSLPKEAQVLLLSRVMRRAGKIVISNQATSKAAADAKAVQDAKATKDAETQKRLRSNQDNPSNTVVLTPSGKQPKGDRTLEETIHEKVVAAQRQAGASA